MHVVLLFPTQKPPHSSSGRVCMHVLHVLKRKAGSSCHESRTFFPYLLQLQERLVSHCRRSEVTKRTRNIDDYRMYSFTRPADLLASNREGGWGNPTPSLPKLPDGQENVVGTSARPFHVGQYKPKKKTNRKEHLRTVVHWFFTVFAWLVIDSPTDSSHDF